MPINGVKWRTTYTAFITGYLEILRIILDLKFFSPEIELLLTNFAGTPSQGCKNLSAHELRYESR